MYSSLTHVAHTDWPILYYYVEFMVLEKTKKKLFYSVATETSKLSSHHMWIFRDNLDVYSDGSPKNMYK